MSKYQGMSVLSKTARSYQGMRVLSETARSYQGMSVLSETARSCLDSLQVADTCSCNQVVCLDAGSPGLRQLCESTSWMPQWWRSERSVLQNSPPWNVWCSGRERSDQTQPLTAASESATFQSRSETSSTGSLDLYTAIVNIQHFNIQMVSSNSRHCTAS